MPERLRSSTSPISNRRYENASALAPKWRFTRSTSGYVQSARPMPSDEAVSATAARGRRKHAAKSLAKRRFASAASRTGRRPLRTKR